MDACRAWFPPLALPMGHRQSMYPLSPAMSDRTPGGTTTLKVRQPSLRDFLVSRRPDTQAIARQSSATATRDLADGAHANPALSGERTNEQCLTAAPGEWAAEPVAHARVTLSRDAEKLRYPLFDRLMQELDSQFLAARTNEANYRQAIEDMVANLIKQVDTELTRPEALTLMREIADEIVGYGPITDLLNDESISEVMVNSAQDVFFERKGLLYRAERTFRDDEHVKRVIDRIVQPLGRRIDESSPMVDTRLPDGSRVNAIIPPLAVKGPSVTIRKFSKRKLTDQELIRLGAMTAEMAEFLRACVGSKLNILVSGGTGSGKTTFLNMLASYIPPRERIVTIEDPAELQLPQENWVSLETRPVNVEGKGLVAQRDLVKNALRMRPDRIIVGECRGSEAFDMLQAMNTGHDGSLTTVHANTPRDAISRVENMVLMANLDLPAKAIREQIASAIHLVVQLSRLSDGSRRVTHVTELVGMEQDIISMQEIFAFRRYGMDENDRVLGALEATGIRPNSAEKLELFGFPLPPALFTVAETGDVHGQSPVSERATSLDRG
jgi:pilus assembly protein CpaF